MTANTPDSDFDRELRYVFGFVIALLAEVLALAFAPDPWRIVATMAVGVFVGYLIACVRGQLRNTPGVDELRIVRSVREYIHIGNDRVHRHKRIADQEHEKLRFDWLITRAQDQTLNNITVWSKNRHKKPPSKTSRN